MTNNVEERVARHYSHGALEGAILDALVAAGKNPDHFDPADLSPMDELHTGGRQATAEFAPQMGMVPGSYVLDVGCGIGGPSRYFAREMGCRVAGIDLTEEFVRVAESLSKRAGMDGAVSYRQASALDIPFQPETFDGAYMFHVGMNIKDKAALFREIRRVLKPGAVFGIYDVMREQDGEMSFPVPWAQSQETSFVESTDTYRRLLQAAGLEVQKERNRRSFGIEFFQQVRERMAANGGKPPVLGINVLMGADWQQKLSNFAGALGRGLLAPVEMVCRAR